MSFVGIFPQQVQYVLCAVFFFNGLVISVLMSLNIKKCTNTYRVLAGNLLLGGKLPG